MEHTVRQAITVGTFLGTIFAYAGESLSWQNSGSEMPATIYAISDPALASLFGRLQKDLYEAQREAASYRKKLQVLDQYLTCRELAHDREKDVLLTEIEELKNTGITAPFLYNSDERLQNNYITLLPANLSGYFLPEIERSQSAPPYYYRKEKP